MNNYRRIKDVPRNGVTFTKPSMTIPEQALSMRQILDRYAKGLPLGGNDVSSAIYDEESNGVNPKTLDLVDLEYINEQNEAFIKKHKDRDKFPDQRIKKKYEKGEQLDLEVESKKAVEETPKQ